MSRPGRVLLVTCDAAGNLPPERSLVRALVARGHEVEVLAHPSLRARLEADGARFHEYRSMTPLSSIERIEPDIELERTLEHLVFAKGVADDMLRLIEELEPQVLLIDGMLLYGLVASRVSGVPTITLWHTIYSLVTGGPFAELFDSRLHEINEYAIESGLEPFPSHRCLIEADHVLVFSYGDGFDDTTGLPQNVHHVGPLRSIDPEATGDYTGSSGAPLVVVGLSTSYMGQQALLQKLCDALAGLPIRALITTGPAIAPEELTTAPNTTAVEFVAHDRVLPSADLLVTHAGHGTVSAGLTYGVPMVCIPLGRDQPMVAERVEALGLGTVVDPEASVEKLAESVVQVLADPEARERAKRFAQRVKRHAGIDEAIGVVEEAIGSTPCR